jgi:hypothetical protein
MTGLDCGWYGKGSELLEVSRAADGERLGRNDV